MLKANANLCSLVILVLLLPFFNKLAAQQQQNSVLIIGNFADIENLKDLNTGLSSKINESQSYSLIVLNGDIVKTDLSIRNNYEEAKTRLQSISKAVRSKKNSQLLIVPGDRDWMSSGSKGLQNVELLERLVKDIDEGHIIFDPDDGCPGPKLKSVGKRLNIVSINTQWFNHPFDKPRNAQALCEYINEVDFIEELGDMIDETRQKNLLIIGHYPIVSNGIYGGHTPLSWHLVPAIGSIYTAYRKNIGNHKDIINRRFNPIRKRIEKLFAEREGIVYASGHEYNIQQLRHDNNIMINSGGLENTAFLRQKRNNLYASSSKGIVELRYYDNGDVKSSVHKLVNGAFTQVDETLLMSGKCDLNDEKIIINRRFDDCNTSLKTQKAKVVTDTIIAGAEYSIENTNTFLLGERYRKSWSTQIKVPILDLDTTKGGLVPYKLGGGRQTRSLKFKGKDGRKYTFRSVNKDLKPVLPRELIGTGAAHFIQDQTSAQQPYGAMAVDIMLNEFDIPHAHPKLYIMPDHQKLSGWRSEFSGMLGMLEEDPKDWESKDLKGFYGANDIEKSYELFDHLYESKSNAVDVNLLAKARIFDVLVGDWGKHQDNWKWAEYKSDTGSLYKPIPRDRDHVFSKWDGVLPYLYSREWAAGNFSRFNEKTENIEEFVWPARELDRELLTELDRNQWLEHASTVKNKLTDDVIHRAILNMPQEIYDHDGKEIEEILKIRRDNLIQTIDEYYHFLAEEVNVVGSNEPEYFTVMRNGDGTVEVFMHAINEQNEFKDEAKQFYYRKFMPQETKEINLYGLGENDVFELNGNVDESILVRIVSGPGKDKIIDRSSVKGLRNKTLIYEKEDNTVLNLSDESKLKKPVDDNLYYYHRDGFKYNRYKPAPGISYNRNDGFGVSLGIKFINQKWNKQDYNRSHTIRGSITTAGFYSLGLENRFHHVLGRQDLIFNIGIARPGDTRFFYGYGTSTVLDENLREINFYTVRRQSVKLETGIARKFLRKSEVKLLARYERSNSFSDDENILRTVTVTGENKYNSIEGVFKTKIDFLDHSVLPKNGTRLFLNALYGTPLVSDQVSGMENYYLFDGGAEFYTSSNTRLFPLTVGLKSGYKRASRFTPFYKMPSAGLNNDLKGYQRNRFSANRIGYFSSELRIKMFSIAQAFVPLEFGISGFYDLSSINPTRSLRGNQDLLDSYGGGIYIIPWNRNFSFNLSVGFSDEESGLIVFGLGTLLN